MECEIKNIDFSDNLGDSEMVPAGGLIVQQRPQVMTYKGIKSSDYFVNFQKVHLHPRTSENTHSSDSLFNTQTAQVSERDVLPVHRISPLIKSENINSSDSLFNSHIRPDILIQPRLDFANERVRKNVATRFKEKNVVPYNRLHYKPAPKKLSSYLEYISARPRTEVTMSYQQYLGLMLSRAKYRKEELAHLSGNIKRQIQEVEKQYGTEISTPRKQHLELLHSETKVAEESLAFLTARIQRLFEKLRATEIPPSYKRCLIFQNSKAKIHGEKIALLAACIKGLCLRLLGTEMRTACKQDLKLMYSKIKSHECHIALLAIDIKKQIKTLEILLVAEAKMMSPFKRFLGLVHSKEKSHEEKITVLARSVKSLMKLLVKLKKEAKSKTRQGIIPDDLLEGFKAIRI